MADVGSASADSADHNCLHCLFFFCQGKKKQTQTFVHFTLTVI